jgi:hypothetical protein
VGPAKGSRPLSGKCHTTMTTTTTYTTTTTTTTTSTSAAATTTTTTAIAKARYLSIHMPMHVITFVYISIHLL